MNKLIQKIVLSTFGIGIASLQLVNAQPVSPIQDPDRVPFENYTVVGFFTTAPPVIDAIIDDYCWTRPVAASNASSGGAGFDGTDFPSNQYIKTKINIADRGVVAPGTVPPNPFTGTYPTSAGSFGMCWDLNYVYFAIKISNPAVGALTAPVNDRGAEIFFNNGNGRSGVDDPINDTYPRLYNNLRDMQVQLWYVPKPGDTEFPLLGAIDGLANYGISLPPSGYTFAVKNTSDGYVYEGRIAWTVLNKEFINEADGSYVGDSPNTLTGTGTIPNSKWRPLKGRLLGVDVGASLLRGTTTTPEQMNWNQCCWDANWTRSAYYGYFLLAGDTASAVCPSSYTVTLTNSTIATPNKKETVGATDFFPLDAAREINWTLSGSTPDGHPYALIDNNTGVITPLNNGVLTITGKSKIARCAAGTISGTVFLTIGSQIAPTAISITGIDINTNWGESDLVASADPPTAPSDVIWSIDPATNLASINSITGVLKATALGSGPVTVKATSIATGLVGTKVVNVTTPVVISSCIGVNSYSYIYQCNRTLNAMTIAGFKIGQKITVLSQYFDPASTGTIPGIPSDLMDYTIQQNVAAASISKSGDWELTLNQLTGFFSITGVYLNDPTKKVQVRVTLKGSTTLTGCDATTSGVNYFSVNNANVCGTLTGIDDNLIEASSFELFPNPTDGDVNVGVTLQAGGVLSIAIVNILGEVVVSSSATKHSGYSLTKLSTASLPPGLYVVQASVSGGGVIAKKLLVTK